MHGRILITLLALEAVAHAQVSGEVAVGGGDDTTNTTTGYVVMSADVAARIGRPAPPIEHRGAAICDPGGEGCLWIFTGLDHDDRDEVGASATGAVHYATDDIGPTSTMATRAWARGAGWQLEGRAVLQPTGDLRDRFWRSGRNVMQTNVAVEIPGMWSLGTQRHQLVVGSAVIDLGHRWLHDGGWQAAGFDRDVTIRAARIQSASVVFDLFKVHYAELGAGESTMGPTTYGKSAATLDFDLAAIEWQLSSEVALVARGGFTDEQPVAPFMVTGTSEVSYGPGALAPAYWLEVQWRRSEDPSQARFSLGAGAWNRLDPSGHAVDAGYLTSGSMTMPVGKLRARAELQVGRLERILVGDLAPPTLAPVGTLAWMGRLSNELAWDFTPHLEMVTTSWVERSDRDDPRWETRATGAVTTRFGGDVSARWHFK